MISVGESARKKIADIKDSGEVPRDHFVRVSVVSGGCSGLTYDMDFDNEVGDDDQVFEDNGIKIVTDPKSFMYLLDTTLEFSGGLNGEGFHFHNPNAQRTCACGESFSL